MSVNRRHGTIIFHCDICGVRRLDRIKGNSLHAVTRRLVSYALTRPGPALQAAAVSPRLPNRSHSSRR